MSESTIVTEFGSSKIAMGLVGEGVPLKVWTSLDHGFLVRKNNSKNQQQQKRFLRPSHQIMKNNDDFLLLDLESCGLLGSYFYSNKEENYSSTTMMGMNHQQLFSTGPSNDENNFQLKQNLFTGMIRDPQISGQILRQMYFQAHLDTPDNMMFLPPYSIDDHSTTTSSSSSSLTLFHNNQAS